jgi:ClpP class serine protease
MPNWGFVLSEIQKERDEPGGDSAADKVRLRYLQKIQKHTNRNIICYYSGFLSKSRQIEGLEINDEDTNGFMLCIHKLQERKKLGLDLLLHTPGGDGDTTEFLIHYLRKMFGNNIRAFVPQLAMSAGTIIACACKEIFLGNHSNLGPVDPQVNGIAAYGVLAEIETAFKEIRNDENRSYVWNPILSNYTPGFVQKCIDAKDSAKKLVTGVLKENMLSSLPEDERIEKAEKIYLGLTDEQRAKGHGKHIPIEDLDAMGLTVHALEDPKDRELQDLVLTVHHCMMYTFANTGATKIIENHLGHRWVKMLLMQQMPQPQIALPPDIIDGLRQEMEREKAKAASG